eukprot:evm.model.scf_89.11 EVM.evm.TU.scf_89.11   scf_89:49156-49807(-)
MHKKMTIEERSEVEAVRKSSMFHDKMKLCPKPRGRRPALGVKDTVADPQDIPATSSCMSAGRAVSSCFMSQVPRASYLDDRNFRGRPPGPAFYSPQANDRKSFHLNARRRFVPSC